MGVSSLSYGHIVVWAAVLLSQIDPIDTFYELPLKDIRHMNLSSDVAAVYNHSSYKGGEFKVEFKCYNEDTAGDDENSNNKPIITTHFYMQFSYGFSQCLSISPIVKLNETNLTNCSIEVNCKETFQKSSFNPIAYKMLPNGTLTKEKCAIDFDQQNFNSHQDSFNIINPIDGAYFLSIQLRPIKADTNYTIEMNVELESHSGHLMMIDYSVYKFHVSLCCFYFVIVLTSAVYFVYLRRNTNKLHSILGISLLTGLLASFFYISAYESLNRNVASVYELKNVMVIAAVLSSIRRIAIDVTILLVSVGYTILPKQNLSIRRPLIIFTCYAVVYVSLTMFTHVSVLPNRVVLYCIFLLNNSFTTVIYVFCFVYLRNTANHSYQRRSPQMEYIGIFYKRFGYVLALLIGVLGLFTLPQLFQLFRCTMCSSIYQMVLFETFWILHSLVCTIAIFLLIVFHPNAQTEIYGSFNFNYSQLPRDDTESINKFPLSSANMHIKRSNTEIRDAFTLFDEAEDNSENIPTTSNNNNNNIVRLHKIQ